MPRSAGPVTIAVLVVVYTSSWLVVGPADGETWVSHLGQLAGADAVLLMSIGLVLISTLPWVEHWFDGIDRTAIWHRRLAIVGLLLLLPHVLYASGSGSSTWGPTLAVVGLVGLIALVVWAVLPRWRSVLPSSLQRPVWALLTTRPMALVGRLIHRTAGGYERWRMLHRTTGVFLAFGFAHGLLDGTAFDGEPLLRWPYTVVGGIGLAFYVYRELLARRFSALHDYQVADVREIAPGLTEITMVPLGRHLSFKPGQFAMFSIEAKDGWHRHPFTIASAPSESAIRITVKALGDWTGGIHELLRPGMPAVLGGPHGRFNHQKGGARQVWIAGGVGVTPFLSWLRGLPEHPVRGKVDFFYASSESPIPYAEEIARITADHPLVRSHVVDTTVSGRLTGASVLAEIDEPASELSVFLCGPESMVSALSSQLRGAGVPSRRIHREYFDWR